MLRNVLRLIVLLSLLVSGQQARAIAVSINTDSARAVLLALQNPSLSHDEALKIAGMYGNQGMIQKMNEFHVPATTESLADALVAAAHNVKVTVPNETIFLLDMVKPKVPELLKLVLQIAADPQAFQGSIKQRIGLFAPPDMDIKLQGYIVAAGDGGGYAFGTTDFYLNVGIIDDFPAAKIVTTHEMYHAVQGAFTKDREIASLDDAHVQGHTQKACVDTEHLFSSLYREGSATYVEDISLLPQSHSVSSTRALADLNDGLAHVHNSATLLELSVDGLRATDAVSFDDVYDVGFFGHGVLYDVGYVMAKAIAEDDGPQGLASYLKQPSYKFVSHYTQLPKYGMDKDHPILGPNTIAAANQLASGCK